MKQLSDLLKEIKKEKIKILPKKESISLIAQMVKLHKDPLTNWKIVAKRLKTASDSDATKIFLAVRQGTWEWSKDYKGAFESMCKRLRKEIKPKQQKLL